METELCKLAYKYGTDKCPKLNHNYTPVYYELLKDKKVKKVLEIGIGNKGKLHHIPKQYKTGASLFMWREFFPKAHIYGIDTDPETIFQDDRITTMLCNSTKGTHVKRMIKTLGNDFDLVIDDGNHRVAAQLRTATNLVPLLKKGAIYIIEDCKDVFYLAGMLDKLFICSAHRFTRHRKQDTLIIIKK